MGVCVYAHTLYGDRVRYSANQLPMINAQGRCTETFNSVLHFIQ